MQYKASQKFGICLLPIEINFSWKRILSGAARVSKWKAVIRESWILDSEVWPIPVNRIKNKPSLLRHIFDNLELFWRADCISSTLGLLRPEKIVVSKPELSNDILHERGRIHPLLRRYCRAETTTVVVSCQLPGSYIPFWLRGSPSRWHRHWNRLRGLGCSRRSTFHHRTRHNHAPAKYFCMSHLQRKVSTS